MSNAGIDREESGENFRLVIRAGKESCGLNRTGCTGSEGKPYVLTSIIAFMDYC